MDSCEGGVGKPGRGKESGIGGSQKRGREGESGGGDWRRGASGPSGRCT